MKSRNIVMTMMVVIVVWFAGCTSLPQKTVLPVVVPPPQPYIEVAPAPLPPQPVDEVYIGGSGFESDTLLGGQLPNGQQLFGGFNEKEPTIAQVQPPLFTQRKPVYRQQPHQHDIYPVEGKAWTNECSTCGDKVGLSQ